MGLLDQLALHSAGLAGGYLEGQIGGEQQAYQRQVQQAQLQALARQRAVDEALKNAEIQHYQAESQRLNQPALLPWEKEGLPRTAYANTASGHLQWRKDLAAATEKPPQPSPFHVTDAQGNVHVVTPSTTGGVPTSQVVSGFTERVPPEPFHPERFSLQRGMDAQGRPTLVRIPLEGAAGQIAGFTPYVPAPKPTPQEANAKREWPYLQRAKESYDQAYALGNGPPDPGEAYRIGKLFDDPKTWKSGVLDLASVGSVSPRTEAMAKAAVGYTLGQGRVAGAARSPALMAIQARTYLLDKSFLDAAHEGLRQTATGLSRGRSPSDDLEAPDQQ